jgi:hypothetical protein
MRGVHPELSMQSTSSATERCCRRSETISRWPKETAQWRGRRESGSERVDSLGLVRRRDSTFAAVVGRGMVSLEFV